MLWPQPLLYRKASKHMLKGIIYWIFAICVLMGGILLAIGLADSVPNAGGVPHPAYPGMVVGEDGAARLQHIGSLAFAFNALLLTLVVCLSVLGVSERHRSPKFLAAMAGSLIFMLLVWWMMYSTHQEFLRSGETGYFMGFPIPTAWQMYGTWLGAIPLIITYSLGFRHFIYTEEDEAEFNALLKQSQQEQDTQE